MAQYSGMWTLSQVSQAVKNQTWTGIPPSVVEYLVVAGGGGGGGPFYGGGGGAGGLLAGYVGITPGTSYFVTVGAGGAQVGVGVRGNAGNNSVFDAISSGASTGSIVAIGGGEGGGGGQVGYPTNTTRYGGSGGSGGGAGEYAGGSFGGAGIAGQGNAGAGQALNSAASYYGGGGGAGTAGITMPAKLGGAGGAGISSAISGTPRMYAGGGGQGTNENFVPAGGAGGGGNGGAYLQTSAPGSGGLNTGGGGGGGSDTTGVSAIGAAGGSGVVIIRYPGTTQFFTGGTLSYGNGHVIHTFYANGTLAPTAPTLYVNPDYQIARSLRFNLADSAYLNRTPATTTNRTTWTWSGWVKRASFGSSQVLFGAGPDASNYTIFYFSGTVSENLEIYNYTGGVNNGYVYTTSVFRDPSAWYHIVLAVDTTQATSADRTKIYVNGVLQPITISVTFASSLNTWVNTNNNHRLGSTPATGALYGGYMTDVHFIDGQALTPSSFGWTNPATGVWSPLDFVGTYGTNGFNLNFSDNSNVTAATLGADTSGNGNNWTPNNFSVTAGVDNDSMVDTPTPYGTDTGVGGEVRGNYCTINPLRSGSTLTNGNLNAAYLISNSLVSSTFGLTSGKWYWEATITNGSGEILIGVENGSASLAEYLGYNANGWGYDSNGSFYNNGGTATGTTFTTNDVIGVAVDMDAKKLWFSKNGTFLNSGSPTSGTNAIATNLSATIFPAFNPYDVVTSCVANFGQRAFSYTAPSGYKALCTTNLPTPTIGATSATLASEFFDTSIWAGNGDNVNPRLITSNVDLANGGGLIWIKGRDVAVSHYLVDSVRGYTKYLAADTAAIDDTFNAGVAGTTNGFTFTGSSSTFNQLPYNYVGWQWKAGSTAVTNTSGSITSSVSASPTSGFSVVTYTGNGTAGATVGHGLGTVPQMILVKNRVTATSWRLYHVAIGNLATIFLDTDAAIRSDINPWNSTTPTSTVLSLGSDAGSNESGATFVAYCFAPIAGYSAFGSYTGNGNASGPFVHLGFRPAFLLIRTTGNLAGYHWFMFDNKRDPYNLTQNPLGAAANSAEPASASGYRELDMLSNGFKIRASGDQINYSTQQYIYMAFAENPFKYSLAR